MQLIFGNAVTTAATILAGACSCALAASIDLRTRRVPNWLTLSTVLFALLLAGVRGPAPFAVSCGVLAAGLAIGTLVHACGLLGGGDVKLLIGIAALVGFPSCVALLLYTALAGGVLAIAVSALHGRLGRVMRSTYAQLFVFLTARRIALTPAADQVLSRERLPYAVAIAAGFGLVVLSQTYLPAIRILL